MNCAQVLMKYEPGFHKIKKVKSLQLKSFTSKFKRYISPYNLNRGRGVEFKYNFLKKLIGEVAKNDNFQRS